MKKFKRIHTIEVAKKAIIADAMMSVDYKISYDAGDRETPSGSTVDFDYLEFYNYLMKEYGDVVGLILYETFDDFDIEAAILEISGEDLNDQ